jgi:hypothetical protein
VPGVETDTRSLPTERARPPTRYFHADNLGSIAVITDETGPVVERDGYNARGKRRSPTGADDPTGSLTSQTTRGFTAQEALHDAGLVHLNPNRCADRRFSTLSYSNAAIRWHCRLGNGYQESHTHGCGLFMPFAE